MPSLRILKQGTGDGTIYSDPAGIECGTVCSYPDVPVGFNVTLGAVEKTGSRFDSWAGYTDTGQTTVSGEPLLTSTANPITGAFPNYPLLIVATFSLLQNENLPAECGELSAVEHCPPQPRNELIFQETVIVPGTYGPIPGFGFHGVRLGHDCPCGQPHHIYRIAYRFTITNIPGGQQAVFFSTYRLINVNPSNLQKGANMLHPGVGTAVLEWVQHDGVIDDAPMSTLVYNATALWQAPEKLTPQAPEGRLTANITQAFNTAKAQGYSNLVLRMRLEDESPTDCLDGSSWYCLGVSGSAAAYAPILQFTIPEPISATAGGGDIARMAYTVIEPCASLGALPAARPEARGYGKRDIRVVRRGNAVKIDVLLEDNATRPARTIPAEVLVLLTLRAANGTVVADRVVMTQTQPRLYRYVYRTKPTDPLGLYLAEFDLETGPGPDVMFKGLLLGLPTVTVP
jgi:hypothetical protein